MKFLKYLIYFLVAILVIYLILCAVAPKQLDVEATESIEAPANMVYNQAANLKNWANWSAWNKMDTSMVTTYGDKTEGVGASYSWTSEMMGAGGLKIVEAVIGESMKAELTFIGSDDVSNSSWKFNKSEEGKTDVTWDFVGSETPFLQRPMNLIMKGGLLKSLKDGLAGIKTIAEKRASERIYDGYKVNEVDLPERHFVMQRQEVEMANIQQFYATNLGSLFSKVQKAGVEMAGMPCGLFFKWDQAQNKTDMAAAIPVAESLIIDGVSSLSIPARKALQVDFYGEYHDLSKAHNAIDAYMKDYGILNDIPIIEEYVTDPSTEKDPSKWLTKVSYYPAQ